MFNILVEVSARHVHLSRYDLDVLFGKDYQLTKVKNLSQLGEFASQEKVILQVGDKKIPNVRILGPLRDKTQVEISKTDARYLKINPPLRLSGNLDGSEKCVLIGPKGKVQLEKGVIISWRHIHLDPATAKKYNLREKQFVSVKIIGDREIIFHKVFIRIAPNFRPACHIDTDEGNAAGIKGEIEGEVILD